MVSKLGFLVTVPTESHPKAFPAQGYWRSEAFFLRGGTLTAQVPLRP